MTCPSKVEPFGCGHPIVLVDRSKRVQHLEDETWCPSCPLRLEVMDDLLTADMEAKDGKV
jgi:hypothetical protein